MHEHGAEQLRVPRVAGALGSTKQPALTQRRSSQDTRQLCACPRVQEKKGLSPLRGQLGATCSDTLFPNSSCSRPQSKWGRQHRWPYSCRRPGRERRWNGNQCERWGTCGQEQALVTTIPRLIAVTFLFVNSFLLTDNQFMSQTVARVNLGNLFSS